MTIGHSFPTLAQASEAVLQELVAAAEAHDIERTDKLLDLLRDIADLEEREQAANRAALAENAGGVEALRDRLASLLSPKRILQLGIGRH